MIKHTVDTSVRNVCASTRIGERDLLKQLLLHLPRFSVAQLMSANVIRTEAERLGSSLMSRRDGFTLINGVPTADNLSARKLVLREVTPEIARIIHERFHYIGSFHPGSVHLGLFFENMTDLPAALASVAPMDIHRLDKLFPSIEEKKKVLVLSRVFAFDWAPRNSISYLLGRVNNWIKGNMPEVTTLLTFLNPNLGFSGSSFKAANWNPFLEIEPVCEYLDGDYVSYRTMAGLSEFSRKRVKHCALDLRPLKLLRYDI